jgi:hypothetical protein
MATRIGVTVERDTVVSDIHAVRTKDSATVRISQLPQLRIEHRIKLHRNPECFI